MTGPSRLGGAVSERLRRLDDTLGIDHNGGSEWIWGVPAFIFVATVVGFIVIGQIIGMGAAMAAPIGTVIAVVMAGLAIAYMTPVADDAASGPPPEHHDDTPLGSPGGPWVVVEHLPSRPRLDANPTPAPADRELAAIAGPQHGEGVRVGGRRRLHHQGSGYMRGYERRVPGPALAAHRRTGGPQIPCYAREYGGAQSTLLELS